jgi:hypothetical protein
MSSDSRNRLDLLVGCSLLAVTLGGAAAINYGLLLPTSAVDAHATSQPQVLRVCADPRDVPSSNERGEGVLQGSDQQPVAPSGCLPVTDRQASPVSRSGPG